MAFATGGAPKRWRRRRDKNEFIAVNFRRGLSRILGPKSLLRLQITRAAASCSRSFEIPTHIPPGSPRAFFNAVKNPLKSLYRKLLLEEEGEMEMTTTNINQFLDRTASHLFVHPLPIQ